MAGVYRPRHPERTVFYRVLFYYFERFLADYESRFEREYGFLWTVVKEVVERYLDCGNPKCGFARIRCQDCGEERLLFLERLFFLEKEGKVGYRYGRNGAKQEVMDYLELIARVTSHIPDKGQVMVRYYGLYGNAHRGKVRKASLEAFPLLIVEEELRRIPSKGWAAMIRKVYEVDPMLCLKCGGVMKVTSFLTDFSVVDRIIDHLKMTLSRGEAPAASGLLAGVLDGRYILGRIFS